MAKYSSADVGFYLVGGYDVLGYQTTITVKKEKLTEETHVLGDAWIEHDVVKLQKAQIAQDGFYDDVSDGNNDALLANVGTANVLCLGGEGNTIGKQFIGFAGALQADYERIVSRGAFHKAKAMHEGVGAVEEAVVLHTHSTETAASGNTESTPHDNGASSANGGSGYLQVSALTLGGYTSVTVKVRHSTDNVTYADLITFTVVTAAKIAERKAVAGTINRYTASSWAFNGAGSGQSVKLMAGVHRD